MVDIIGRAKVIAETVVDEQQARKAGKKAGDAVADEMGSAGDLGGQTFGAKLGPALVKAAGALGVGAAIGNQILTGIEREAEGARLSASLGLDGKEAAELNAAASEIYKDAWGASFADVQKGVAATKSSFEDLRGEQLTEAAKNAQIFSDIFAVDVVEAAGVASVAVKQGLAKDAVEAFDLMTRAAQEVPIQFRGELLEAVTEYSQFFHQIGIDGPEAFALLAEGAALGQYGIDKTGDAIKEFGIRAIDASATTADAFKTLNLDIDAMQTALAGGGDEAEAAFRKIVDGLTNIEDPAEQAQTAIALFGTPVEDLGNEKLPVFIEQLAAATTGLDNYDGATERAGDQSTTFSSKIKSLGRTFDVNLGRAIEDNNEAWAKWGRRIGGVIGGAIDELKEYWEWVRIVASEPDPITDRDREEGASDVEDLLLNGRASGGPARGLTLVGENGPELAQFSGSGGYVYNNSQTREMLAGAATAQRVTHLHFHGPENLAEARRREDWSAKYGTRFGAATNAGAM